jgi:hypothetical protein
MTKSSVLLISPIAITLFHPKLFLNHHSFSFKTASQPGQDAKPGLPLLLTSRAACARSPLALDIGIRFLVQEKGPLKSIEWGPEEGSRYNSGTDPPL